MRVVHVLRKPVSASIAANVLEHGTGGLHIDAARVSIGAQPKPTTAPGWDAINKVNAEQGYRNRDYAQGPAEYVPSPLGRWPTNLILVHRDECCSSGCSPGCSVAHLDQQSGDRRATMSGNADPSQPHRHRTKAHTYKGRVVLSDSIKAGSVVYADSGGASRYFKQIGGKK